MKKLFKIALYAAAFSVSFSVFAEILPVSPAEGSTVPLLSASQKKLKEFSSPEERKAAIEADQQEKKLYFGKNGLKRSQIPVVFSWECTAGETGPFRIVISETPDFARPIYSGSVKGRKIRVLPVAAKFKIGQKYYWKVVGSGKSGTAESAVFSFRTEDLPPRWISLNGRTGNVRDLGGYRTVDGRRVRQNMLLRGQALNFPCKDGKTPGKSKLTDADLDYFLKELKVRTVLDLRGTRETAGMKVSPLGDAVQYIRHDTPMYGKIFTKWGKGLMAANFRTLCNAANYPIYFHCRGGADRTGSLAFILEAVLGFPEKEIELDYERTFYPYQRNGAFWKSYQALKAGLMKYGSDGDTLQRLAELYLMDCGITREEIESFRAIMLEK